MSIVEQICYSMYTTKLAENRFKGYNSSIERKKLTLMLFIDGKHWNFVARFLSLGLNLVDFEKFLINFGFEIKKVLKFQI